MAFRTRVGYFVGAAAGPELVLDTNNTEKYFPLFVVSEWLHPESKSNIIGREALDHMLTELDPYLTIFGLGNVNLTKRVSKAIEGAAWSLIQKPKASNVHFRQMDMDPAFSANGLSLAAAVVQNEDLSILHLGNCRTFLSRNGSFSPINKPHFSVHAETAVPSQLPLNVDPDRVLGMSSTPKIDCVKLSIQDSDRVLLCNEILFDTVSKVEIQNILRNENDTQAAVDRIVSIFRQYKDDKELAVLLVRFDRINAKTGLSVPYRIGIGLVGVLTSWGLGYLLLQMLFLNPGPVALWILSGFSLWFGATLFLYLTFTIKSIRAKKEADYRFFTYVLVSALATMLILFIGTRFFEKGVKAPKVEESFLEDENLGSKKPLFETTPPPVAPESNDTIKDIANSISRQATVEGIQLYSGIVITKDLKVPYSLDVDDNGGIYVVDDYQAGIVKVSSDGKISLLNTAVKLVFPTDVVCSGGNFYLVDFSRRINRVFKLNSQGGKVLELGSGAVTFFNPKAAVLDSRGNLYVADRGNNRIVKFDSSGKLITTIKLGRNYSEPNGVAIDSVGDLWVTLKTPGKLLKIVNDEKITEVLIKNKDGSRYSLSLPGGIDADNGKRLFIADTGNERVIVIDRDGNLLRRLEEKEMPGSLEHPPKGLKVGPKNDYLYVVGGNMNNYNPGDDHRTQGILWRVKI